MRSSQKFSCAVAGLLALLSACSQPMLQRQDARIDGERVADADVSDASPASRDDAMLDSGESAVDDAAMVDGARADVPVVTVGRCAVSTERALMVPSDTVSVTTAGLGTINTASCVASAVGREAIFPLELPRRTGVVLSARASTPLVALTLRSNCEDSTTEEFCAASTFSAPQARARAIVGAGRWFVVADPVSALAATVEVQLQTFDPAPNARCDEAMLLREGAPVADQHTDRSVAATGPCRVAGGNTLTYRVEVPAYSRAIVTATPRPTSAAPLALRANSGCADTQCPAVRTATAASEAVELALDHRADGVRAWTVYAGSNSATADATFDISVRFVALPRNGECSMPMPVSAGATIPNQRAELGGADSVCGASVASALFYSLEIPPMSRVLATVRATSGPPWPVGIVAMDGCGASSCLRNDWPLDPTDPPSLKFDNDTSAPRSVLLATAGRGTFDLVTERFDRASNANCATPRLVVNGERLRSENLLRAATVTANCYGGSTNLPELYYRTTIPAGHTLRVRAAPVGTPRWRAGVRVMNTCAATTCLVVAAEAGLGRAQVAEYTNRAVTPFDVLIAVTAFYPTAGLLELDVDHVPPPTNAVCSSATPVALGTPVLAQDIARGVSDLSASCLPSVNGPTLFYSTMVPANSVLVATARPMGFWDAAVRVLDGCGGSCLSSADTDFVDRPETARYANTTSAPRSVIVAVSSVRSTLRGTFDLQLNSTPITPAHACSTAQPITDGTVLMNQDASSAIQSASGCNATMAANVLSYTATVPPRTSLVLRVTPTGVPWRPVVRLQPTCGAACLLLTSGLTEGAEVTATYTNASASPATVIVTVGAGSYRDFGGSFDLRASFATPPPNATCSSATPIVVGDTIANQDVSTGLDNLASTCVGSSGPTLYYAAAVPARTRMVFAATPDAGPIWIPILRLFSACGAPSCIAFTDTTLPGTTREIAYNNATDAPVNIVLAVSSVVVGSPGRFSLSTRTYPIAPNATCATALALASEVVAANQDTLGATEAPRSCVAGYPRGNVLYYTTNATAGSVVIARATPVGPTPQALVMRMEQACGAACLLWATSFSATTAAAVAYRSTTASQYWFSVGPSNGAQQTRFDMETAVVPNPSNTTCATARVVLASGVLRNQVVLGGDNLSSTCVPTHGGGNAFYAVDVPPGATLTASAVNFASPGFSLVLRVLEACGAPTCASSSRAPATPARYTNTSAATVRAIVAVGGETPAEWGAFDLTINVAP